MRRAVRATNLAHQKNCIENQPGNNQSKKDDAENEQRDFAQIQQNPATLERDRQSNQAEAENDKKNCGFSSAHSTKTKNKKEKKAKVEK